MTPMKNDTKHSKGNQEMWPFGPAPVRICAASPDGQHDWQIVDLYAAAEPPAPTFECRHCHWKWSRRWTASEFAAWLASVNDTTGYYDDCHFDAEPPYAP